MFSCRVACFLAFSVIVSCQENFTDIEYEQFVKCTHPVPEILNGTLEDMLGKIDRHSIVKNCRKFQKIVPCAHNSVLKLRDLMRSGDIDSNQTVAKYHTMYYACTSGFPLFSQRTLCSAKIDQEAINGGRCSSNPDINPSIALAIQNRSEVDTAVYDCAMFEFYFKCTKNRTETECDEAAHHLNLNIWKIASNYYHMITKCALDLSTKTVFEPESLPVIPKQYLDQINSLSKKWDLMGKPLVKKTDQENLKLVPLLVDGKVKYKISGIVTLERV